MVSGSGPAADANKVLERPLTGPVNGSCLSGNSSLIPDQTENVSLGRSEPMLGPTSCRSELLSEHSAKIKEITGVYWHPFVHAAADYLLSTAAVVTHLTWLSRWTLLLKQITDSFIICFLTES